jgi:hypothetical protein
MAAIDCKFHIIYTITRDDGFFYKGLHSTDDLEDGYPGSGVRVKAWIKKYGIDEFWKRHTKTIDEMLPSRKLLEAREAELITSELLKSPFCLNLSPGGRGGSRFTGKKHTVEARMKMGIASKNHKRSESHKAKISAALIGRVGGFEGKKHSEATKDLMRTAAATSPARKKFCKPCTIDGITIFESMKSMRRTLGAGKSGTGSPNFRYLP